MDNNKEEELRNRVFYKFRSSKIKVATIIAKCEKIDNNSDGIIHVDDLEDIIQELLGKHRLTAREMIYLLGQLTHDKRKGKVFYNNIQDFLEPDTPKAGATRWKTSIDHDNDDAEISNPLPQGSIGEFLQRAACPSEIKNFSRFVSMIEKLERRSGMKVTATAEGFVVPLGPDLRVNINFFLS